MKGKGGLYDIFTFSLLYLRFSPYQIMVFSLGYFDTIGVLIKKRYFAI
jgi:hypothetical protein